MYSLYLDESGKANLKNHNTALPHFALTGIMVHDTSSIFINERSKQIKFKYFGETDIVFHAYEIVNNLGEFSIFKDKSLKEDFLKDLMDLLASANYKIIYAGVNKQEYIDADPQLKKLIGDDLSVKNYENSLTKKLIKSIFKSYLCYLRNKNSKSKCTGSIIIEAADMSSDSLLFEAHHSILGGCNDLNMTNVDVRNILTCISFATKKNNTIEVELADMASYFLNLDHRFQDGKVKKIKREQQEIINILKTKLFKNRCSKLPDSSWYKLP